MFLTFGAADRVMKSDTKLLLEIALNPFCLPHLLRDIFLKFDICRGTVSDNLTWLSLLCAIRIEPDLSEQIYETRRFVSENGPELVENKRCYFEYFTEDDGSRGC
jgi:hypothetical protein